MSLLRLRPPLHLVVDAAAAAGGRQAKRTGRSWWALRYTDGTIIQEWDLDPGSPNGHADWPRVPKRGRQALRLFCPNGKMAEVGGTEDHTGRLFQFKVAARHIGVGVGAIGQEALAHVIGVISGLNGECTLFAWEIHPEPIRPVIDDFKNAPTGALADAYDAWSKLHTVWRYMAGGALVGPLHDNIYALNYFHGQALAADHLGVADGEGR